MDKENVEKMIKSAVLLRVKKSVELGSKATWTAEDHHRMMAGVCEAATRDETLTIDQWVELLKQISNHSALAQKLEKMFAGSGHFERKSKDSRKFEDVMAELEKEVGSE